MPILQQPLISMFTRTWNRRKSASPRCSSLLENREEKEALVINGKKDEVTSNHPILRLLVYVWCYKIYYWEYCVQQTRQENPKKDLHPTIRQPHAFIPWHHIWHIIEMASEDFLIRLSVVFKKFGLIANEFLSWLRHCVTQKSLSKSLAILWRLAISIVCV